MTASNHKAFCEDCGQPVGACAVTGKSHEVFLEPPATFNEWAANATRVVGRVADIGAIPAITGDTESASRESAALLPLVLQLAGDYACLVGKGGA